jgi:hypothetical protein
MILKFISHGKKRLPDTPPGKSDGVFKIPLHFNRMTFPAQVKGISPRLVIRLPCVYISFDFLTGVVFG